MEYSYSVLLEVYTSSISFCCCHICVRKFKKRKRKGIVLEKTELNTGTETEWGLKLWNAWQNFSMEHEVTARRGAIVILMQFNFRMRNLSKNPQPVILFTSSNELRCSPGWGDSFPPPPFFSSQRWNTGEKFNDLSLRQPADFHPGGREEWEECIDVWRQTTALCVLERPDTRRNEPWDNGADCEIHSYNAHSRYVI